MSEIFVRLLRSFHFALRGLWFVFRTEPNFRVQLVIFVLVLIAARFFHILPWQMVALVLVGAFVLVLECTNSAVERLLDLVQPRLHGYVREIKDIMAGAVLVASAGAIVIGLLILLPYLIEAAS